jgi:hypothetical protein
MLFTPTFTGIMAFPGAFGQFIFGGGAGWSGKAKADGANPFGAEDLLESPEDVVAAEHDDFGQPGVAIDAHDEGAFFQGHGPGVGDDVRFHDFAPGLLDFGVLTALLESEIH